MDREDFIRLADGAGRALLAQIDYTSSTDVVALVSRLRSEGHDPATVAAVLTQAKLRKRAVTKFGEFASQMLFTEAGLEQASRLKAAAIHAGRFRSAGIRQVADLGCGIGAESMALASLGIEVKAFEIDEVTAAVATYNLAPFENATVEIADVEALDLSSFEALYFDPARRELHGPKKASTQRHFDPANFSPNYNFVLEKAKTKPTGIKLGPGHDKRQIPEGCEAQWVSVDGDLVELCLWFGKLARESIARSALLISTTGQHEITSPEMESPNADLADIGNFVYEPDNSLIRSGLIADFAKPLGLTLISPEIAYLSSNKKISSPWLKGYEVIDNLVFDRKKLKAYVRENKIGILEIKKRGSDVSPEELRKQLAPKGEGAATLIVTRVGDAHRVLVAQPIGN
ncbi:MAG: SAM-dependent methyltransferase [Rhodoluna sp.]